MKKFLLPTLLIIFLLLPTAQAQTEPEWPEEEPFPMDPKNVAYMLSMGLGLFITTLCITRPKRRKRYKSKRPSYTWATPKNPPKESVKDPIKTDMFTGLENELQDEPLIYPNPYLPEDDAIQLPDLSNPEDDKDWQTCPFCGEWNNSMIKRCTHCDGRLGRPLRRDSI